MNFKHLPLWTPLASILLAAAWVLPNSSPPWLAFHKDAWLAAVLLLVSFALLTQVVKAQVPIRLNLLAAIFLVLAGLPVLQWSLGIVYFHGHALVGTAYFLATALAIVLGSAWERWRPLHLGDFFFMGFLVAALLTTGVMLAQWLQVEINPVYMIPRASGGRPYGNLIQPNHASTVLLLGMTALFWCHARAWLRAPLLFVGSAYLLFFVMLTGSRMGYLSFLGAVIVAITVSARTGGDRRIRLVLLGLLALMPLYFQVVTHDWGLSTGGASAGIDSGMHTIVRPMTHERMKVYQAYLHAALYKPWLGYGFEQGAITQLEAARLGHDLPSLFTWSHNAFLDIATWFGIPAGVMAVLAVVWATVCVLRARPDAWTCLYIAAVYLVCMQGMVELQLAFAYFLLPTGFIFGAIWGRLQLPGVAVRPAWVVLTLVATTAYFALLLVDYARIERAFYTFRFENARVGLNHAQDIPETRVMNHFQALLTGLRVREQPLSADELEDFRQAVFLDPSPVALHRLAVLQAGAGDYAAAQDTANVADTLTRGPMREVLFDRWQRLITRHPAYAAVEWPAP